MDKLETIFCWQKKFDEEVLKRPDIGQHTREEWVQKKVLAMIDELGEVLNEVNYKWWKNPKPFDEHAAKEEMVDVLHFFVSMCLDMGMDAEELYERYMEKNKENFARQAGLSDKKGYAIDEQ